MDIFKIPYDQRTNVQKGTLQFFFFIHANSIDVNKQYELRNLLTETHWLFSKLTPSRQILFLKNKQEEKRRVSVSKEL